jgi:hypothetical protein
MNGLSSGLTNNGWKKFDRTYATPSARMRCSVAANSPNTTELRGLLKKTQGSRERFGRQEGIATHRTIQPTLSSNCQRSRVSKWPCHNPSCLLAFQIFPGFLGFQIYPCLPNSVDWRSSRSGGQPPIQKPVRVIPDLLVVAQDNHDDLASTVARAGNQAVARSLGVARLHPVAERVVP